jgi:hypothetical protein
VYADLRFYYGIDLVEVIEGRGPSPFFVMLLVQRLPDDSMTAALRQGGRQYFGWGQERHILADLYDALNLNTRATGNWTKKPPKIPEYPRPKRTDATPTGKPKVTVKDIFARMQKGM